MPFGSVAFAGVALALVNGVLPTVVVIGALRRRPWAQLGHLAVGAALVGWIVVQVALLGPPLHWLQVLYFAWGLVLVGLALRYRRARRVPLTSGSFPPSAVVCADHVAPPG